MELKTLKDFEEYHTYGFPEMREEAIKWIKEIRKIPENDFIISDYGRLDRHSVVSWIKHFFNITEEDIK